MGKRRHLKEIMKIRGRCGEAAMPCEKCEILPLCEKLTGNRESVLSQRVILAREWLEAHPKKNKGACLARLDVLENKCAAICGNRHMDRNKPYEIQELTPEDVKRREVFMSLPLGEQQYLTGDRHIYINVRGKK